MCCAAKLDAQKPSFSELSWAFQFVFFSLLPPPSTLTGAIKLNQISNGSCCASYDAVVDAGDDDYYYYDTTTATTNTAAASAAMLNMRKLVIRASIVCVCVFAWPGSTARVPGALVRAHLYGCGRIMHDVRTRFFGGSTDEVHTHTAPRQRVCAKCACVR